MFAFLSRAKWKWLVALVPLGIGLILILLFFSGLFENPIAYVRADLATWTLLISLTLTIVFATIIALQEWAGWYREETQSQAAYDRRQFLRRLDHELKNPLTAILAGLANLGEDASPEDRAQTLDSIQTQAIRLSRLSADLRKLAELETRPLERTPVDLVELLQDVYTLSQDQTGAKERKLILTIPSAPWPLPKVPGDRDLLFLAIYNLVVNSIKFSRPGDTIEIRAYEDGSTVAVEVADTGPGIPSDEIPYIWEELYRGQGAQGIPGSGLGLALVRSISERHDGRLTIRSRPGQGTVITFRLPVY